MFELKDSAKELVQDGSWAAVFGTCERPGRYWGRVHQHEWSQVTSNPQVCIITAYPEHIAHVWHYSRDKVSFA